MNESDYSSYSCQAGQTSNGYTITENLNWISDGLSALDRLERKRIHKIILSGDDIILLADDGQDKQYDDSILKAFKLTVNPETGKINVYCLSLTRGQLKNLQFYGKCLL